MSQEIYSMSTHTVCEDTADDLQMTLTNTDRAMLRGIVNAVIQFVDAGHLEIPSDDVDYIIDFMNRMERLVAPGQFEAAEAILAAGEVRGNA